MTVEFARNRIVKIRSDYSKHDLNNRLGFNYNKENKSSDEIVNWSEMR
jgi:hypothetical protein